MPKRGYTTAFGRGNAAQTGANWGQRFQKLRKYGGYVQAAASAWNTGKNFYKQYKKRNKRLTKKIQKKSKSNFVNAPAKQTTMQKPDSTGWGISRVSVVKPVKLFKGIVWTPTCIYEEANGWSVASTTGLGVQTPQANTLSRQTVRNIPNNAVGVNLRWATCQDLLSAAVRGSNTNATQLALSAIGANTTNGYIHYKGITGCHEFTNAEPTNTEVTIYMLTYKHDESDPLEVQDAATAWEDGLNEMAGLSGNTGANNYMPDTTPGMSKKFMNTFKILKRTKIRLNPGQTHKYYFTHMPNKILNYSRLSQKTVIGGVTICFLAVTKGCPVATDTAQTHAAAVLVAYSPQKLVGITTYKYLTRTAVRPSAMRNQVNNISSVAPTNIWEINDDSGLVTNVQPATAPA